MRVPNHPLTPKWVGCLRALPKTAQGDTSGEVPFEHREVGESTRSSAEPIDGAARENRGLWRIGKGDSCPKSVGAFLRYGHAGQIDPPFLLSSS